MSHQFLCIAGEIRRGELMSAVHKKAKKLAGHDKQTKKDGTRTRIDLKIWGQDGTVTSYNVKSNAQLKNLMDAYSKRKGGDDNTFVFLRDGKRIVGTQTPEDLELKDGEQIDAMLHQQGAGFTFVELKHA